MLWQHTLRTVSGIYQLQCEEVQQDTQMKDAGISGVKWSGILPSILELKQRGLRGLPVDVTSQPSAGLKMSVALMRTTSAWNCISSNQRDSKVTLAKVTMDPSYPIPLAQQDIVTQVYQTQLRLQQIRWNRSRNSWATGNSVQLSFSECTWSSWREKLGWRKKYPRTEELRCSPVQYGSTHWLTTFQVVRFVPFCAFTGASLELIWCSNIFSWYSLKHKSWQNLIGRFGPLWTESFF